MVLVDLDLGDLKSEDRLNGIYIGNKKKQGSIVELLRDEILAGNIPDGSEMTQNELAESLGVSRMPVREALILLEYQGLIDRLPNNHVRVASLTEDYFRHILKTGCFFIPSSRSVRINCLTVSMSLLGLSMLINSSSTMVVSS